MLGAFPDSLINQGRLYWPALYDYRFSQLGNTATIFSIGDPRRSGLVTATSFTTSRSHANGLAATVTTRETSTATAPASFATTPFDTGLTSRWQGCIPFITTNGSTQNMDTPDAAYWTSALAAFSVEAWVKLGAASSMIIVKWDETTGAELREWRFYFDSSKYLAFELYDDTANAQIGRAYITAIDLNTWVHVVGTYAGTAASSGVKLYLNGTQVDNADRESGVFVTMQDTATIVQLGCREGTDGARTGFFNGSIAGGPLGIGVTLAELTAAQVKNLYYMGLEALCL